MSKKDEIKQTLMGRLVGDFVARENKQTKELFFAAKIAVPCWTKDEKNNFQDAPEFISVRLGGKQESKLAELKLGKGDLISVTGTLSSMPRSDNPQLRDLRLTASEFELIARSKANQKVIDEAGSDKAPKQETAKASTEQAKSAA